MGKNETNPSDMDGAMVWKRLCVISDQVTALRANSTHFPINHRAIAKLEQERAELIRQHVREAPPYP